MKKMTALALIGICTFGASSICSAQTWRGEFYNITPRHSGVTEEFCKQHVLDVYETSAEMVEKEVTAQNGVKAIDLGYKQTEHDGVFVHTGTADLSGTFEGKPWKTKASYWGVTLEKKGGMEQGAWSTKDCKGFYKVGPKE